MHFCTLFMNHKKGINWLIFILLSIIWGSSFIVMKITKEHLNGYQLGALRMFSAGLVCIPFAFYHVKKIEAGRLPLVFLSALTGNFFPAFLFAIAIEKKIDSALAGILNSLTPLMVILLSVLFFEAKVSVKKMAGVIIGFTGLLILSLSRGGISLHNFGYASLILIATVLYGINVNLVSYYLKETDPLKLATVSLAFISIPAFLILWQQKVFTITLYNKEALPALLYALLLGIVGSALATALFYLLIKRAGGLFASLVTYAIPVVAIGWGLLADEPVTIIQVSCLLLILGGVYLANRGPKQT